MLKNGCLENEAAIFLWFYLPSSRYRKVTTCARVQTASGLKLVSEVPAVMPFSRAQRTAAA